MSSSLARRRLLAAVRTLPQAHCPGCGASFARIDFPRQHLERCEAAWIAAQRADETTPGTASRSLWQRLLGVLGIHSRGASS